jgi:DNA-binding Lrp family transcriptional regulator
MTSRKASGVTPASAKRNPRSVDQLERQIDATATAENSSTQAAAPFNWRDHLKVHPAAELFPLMPEAELRELAEDIKKNGLVDPIVIWSGDGFPMLLDGRNRLDALALVGLLGIYNGQIRLCREIRDIKEQNESGGECLISRGLNHAHIVSGDPYAIALSFNVHRRHLTNEQKRELIAKLIKAAPEKSNRRIAKIVDASHPHVAKVRKDLEEAGDVETVTTSIDTKGRRQPLSRGGFRRKLIKEAVRGGIPSPELLTNKELMDDIAQKNIDANAALDAPPATNGPKAVNAEDIAQGEFDRHILRLIQMTNKARPGRYALKTAVPAADLSRLSEFLKAVAAERAGAP